MGRDSVISREARQYIVQQVQEMLRTLYGGITSSTRRNHLIMM